MSGFLKNLKALFIATDDELLKNEGVSVPPKLDKDEDAGINEGSNLSSSVPASDKSKGTTLGAGQVQRKFIEILLKGLDEENQDGYDYLEFKQALRSLKGMEMDDATRFQSAFAVAKTMGATRERILESGAFYLKILKQEEQQFLQSLKHQRQSRVETPKTELTKIDQWVKDQEAEIDRIRTAIEEKQASKTAKVESIKEAAMKIEQVERDFEASLEYLQRQIESDISNVGQYLK